MNRLGRKTICVIAGLILVGILAWYTTNHAGRVPVVLVEPTPTERTLLALLDYGEVAKYTITGTLPAGTTVRVWIEAYEFGTRVDDIAACEVSLTSKQRGLSFFHLRDDTEVALAVGQPPMGVAWGKYPVEKWTDLPDAMQTSVPAEGDLFDGSLVLRVLTHGVHDQWTDDYLSYAYLLSDHRTRAQLIAGIDHVYILKAQAIRRPRQ